MARFLPHPLADGNPPAWASGWGDDGYGVFAEFTVGEVIQRLRWIPPGRFVMGSPEGEPGRFDNETQHEVEIAEGFWLAETPCTQALWTEITAENPSRFQSRDRPVEQVSWHDCLDFLSKLNERLPTLASRLPSEEEWEYACRAGTEEATYAGRIEILGANDAPVLDRIAWYGGNSGVGFELDDGENSSDWPEQQHEHKKAGTMPVGRKLPNPWGLYDMLGNVYEWCSTPFGLYGNEPPSEPKQAEDRASRVFRGGSWSTDARGVRAAYRNRYVPSDRLRPLGFRLVLGRVLDQAGGRSGAEARSASAQSSG